jgi:hypothetical protein
MTKQKTKKQSKKSTAPKVQRSPEATGGLQVCDVLEPDVWREHFKGVMSDATLASVSLYHLDLLLKIPEVKAAFTPAIPGKTVLFKGLDGKRARGIEILRTEPATYGIVFISFGKHSPELAISCWQSERLRSVGLTSIAAKMEQLSAEEKTALWEKLRDLNKRAL